VSCGRAAYETLVPSAAKARLSQRESFPFDVSGRVELDYWGNGRASRPAALITEPGLTAAALLRRRVGSHALALIPRWRDAPSAHETKVP